MSSALSPSPEAAAHGSAHPPPVQETAHAEAPRAGRLGRRGAALLVFLPCAALLGLAAWLVPDPTGVGTHAQLGIEPCGWMTGLGMPCPTCGMTTAFAHAADGDLVAAFLAQPAGAVLAVAVAMVLLLSLWVLVTGASLAPMLARAGGRWLWWGVGGLILGAWAWKIAVCRGWI